MKDHPRLRSDLRFQLDPEGGPGMVVFDPIDGREIELGGIIGLITRFFDGARSCQEIRDALAVEHDLDHLSAGDIRETAERLESLGLLSFGRARATLALGLFEVHEGPPPASPRPIDVREDLRYACMRCGKCCSGRFIVALDDRDLERLRALPLEDVGVSSLDDAVESTPDGQPLLRWREGRCVFLDPEQGCRLHAAFGAEAKPRVCRAFPWLPLWTPRGGALRFALECARQHQSARSAPLIAPRAEALWRDLVEGRDTLWALPERVPLDGVSREVSYDEYLALEQRWLALVRAADWRAAAQAMREATGLPEEMPLGMLAAPATEAARPFATHTTLRLFDDLIPGGARDLNLLDAVTRALDGALTHETLALRAALDAAAAAVDDTLNRYTLDFLAGKYLFYGRSIASGVALLELATALIRHTAAYVAVTHGAALDEGLLNEAVIFWQLTLFERSEARVAVLERLAI